MKSLSAIINRKLILLHTDNTVKRVFTPKTTVSFLSDRKLKTYLIKADYIPQRERYIYTSVKVNDAKFAIASRKVIHLHVVTTNFKMNCTFDSNEKCLSFLLTFNRYRSII